MLVIGFQEIVPLTAQQIVQTDPEKRLVSQPTDSAANLHYYAGGLGKIV